MELPDTPNGGASIDSAVTVELLESPAPLPEEQVVEPKSLNGITSGSVFKLLFDTLSVTVFSRCRFDPKCSEVLRDLVRQLPPMPPLLLPPLPPPITMLLMFEDCWCLLWWWWWL